MSAPDYLKKVLTARVYDAARETELEHARNLSARLGQRCLPQARRQSAGLLVQGARRLQQDGASAGRGARARCDHRVGGQPCAGCRAIGRAHEREGRDRDAGHDAPGQDRRGTHARRQRGRDRAVGRIVFRCLSARCRDPARTRPDLRPSVRRSRCDRGPGHRCHGNHAPAPGADPRDLRADRRRPAWPRASRHSSRRSILRSRSSAYRPRTRRRWPSRSPRASA